MTHRIDMLRLEASIRKLSNGCWITINSPDSMGYSRISIDGKMKKAHIIMYEHYIEPVSEGLELDHTCRNRRCVNPEHLEAVTHKENMNRSRGEYCRAGHKMPELWDHHYGRRCLICVNNREQRELKNTNIFAPWEKL